MENQDQISAETAANLTGVSISTLERFAEAGYLQLTSRADGTQLLSKRELWDIFGITEEATAQSSASLNPDSTNANSAKTEEEASVKVIDVNLGPNIGPRVDSASPNIETASSIPDTLPDRTSQPASNASEVSALSRELKISRQVAILQERLLSQAEQQIEELKKERDWLKTRIEKLEEKSERDQMLLLSETQVIRRLINAQENKRSTWQKTLEWLGFGQPQSESKAIDISSSRKQDAP